VSAAECAGRLGTPEWQAALLAQGGGWLTELPFTSLSWGRRVDDTSEASCTTMQLDHACMQLLTGAFPYAYELGVYADGERVWSGPIVQIQLEGGQAQLAARDLSAWWDVRWLRSDHSDNGVDGSTIAAAYVSDGMSPDNSPGVSLAPTLCGIQMYRLVYADQHKFVGEMVREVATTAIDWTYVDRDGRCGLVVPWADLPAPITDDHLAASPAVIMEGTAYATRQIVAGDGQQDVGDTVWAIEGGVDSVAAPVGGTILVERLLRQSGLTDSRDAVSLADSILARVDPCPVLISQVQLNPDAPCSYQQLVAGVLMQMRLDRSIHPVLDAVRITSVEVQVSAQQQAQVTLQIQPVGTGGSG
jgi:hypothetical protein